MLDCDVSNALEAVFDGAYDELKKEDLLQMVLAVGQTRISQQEPMSVAVNELCSFHKHDLTEKCKSAVTASTKSRNQGRRGIYVGRAREPSPQPRSQEDDWTQASGW